MNVPHSDNFALYSPWPNETLMLLGVLDRMSGRPVYVHATPSTFARWQQCCEYCAPNFTECFPRCLENFWLRTCVGPLNMTTSGAGVLNPRLVLIRPRRRPYANCSFGFTGSTTLMQQTTWFVLLQFAPYRLSEVQLARPVT